MGIEGDKIPGIFPIFRVRFCHFAQGQGFQDSSPEVRGGKWGNLGILEIFREVTTGRDGMRIWEMREFWGNSGEIPGFLVASNPLFSPFSSLPFFQAELWIKEL